MCPTLVTADEVDWSGIDVAFCGLPHGTAHARDQEAARAGEGGRHVGRLPPARSRHLRRMVWRRAQRAGASRKRRLWADRALPRCDREGADRGLSGLLSHRRVAGAPAAHEERAHRERGHHHRCQVGRVRRRAHPQAEHPVLRGWRGPVPLRHRQPSARAGDRAGARGRGGDAGEGELHAPSGPHDPG